MNNDLNILYHCFYLLYLFGVWRGREKWPQRLLYKEGSTSWEIIPFLSYTNISCHKISEFGYRCSNLKEKQAFRILLICFLAPLTHYQMTSKLWASVIRSHLSWPSEKLGKKNCFKTFFLGGGLVL